MRHHIMEIQMNLLGTTAVRDETHGFYEKFGLVQDRMGEMLT